MVLKNPKKSNPPIPPSFFKTQLPLNLPILNFDSNYRTSIYFADPLSGKRNGKPILGEPSPLQDPKKELHSHTNWICAKDREQRPSKSLAI